jgi:hypothetical protein
MNLDAFIESCGDCRGVQERTLLDIVLANRGCAYGRANGFDRVESIDAYQRVVPVAEWSDLEDYANRSAEGAPDQLFSGDPRFS